MNGEWNNTGADKRAMRARLKALTITEILHILDALRNGGRSFISRVISLPPAGSLLMTAGLMPVARPLRRS